MCGMLLLLSAVCTGQDNGNQNKESTYHANENVSTKPSTEGVNGCEKKDFFSITCQRTIFILSSK